MREWSDLESRYQAMKTNDPKNAESFKKEMTSRFQKTVAALEDENQDEKSQLDDVHQERVQAAMNERKREAIKAYRDALALSMDTAQPHKVLKTLQTYIRAEEKDRTHNLNRFRHLLKKNPDEATEMKRDLLRRLRDIDLRVNGTIAMLHDLPDLEQRVKPVILEFWTTFRKENTPEVGEEFGVGSQDLNIRLLRAMEATFRSAEEPMAEAAMRPAKEEQESLEEHEHDEDVAGRPSFRMRQQFAHETDMSHSEASSSNHTVLILSVGGVALLLTLVLGVLIVRRRPSVAYNPVSTIDATSPEEKHVVNMQVTGYENPTYGYFSAEKA
jgi:hypothetical protein